MRAKDKSRDTKGELTDESQLPSLTDGQLEALRKFALFEIGVDEMQRSLAGVFEFDLEPGIPVGFSLFRTAKTHFRVPEPGIVITREHIVNALERKRFELITERDLVIWATVLLLNDAYVWDPGEEDLIADWLNDISVNLDAS
ncbi:MAG TPA: hypothetical protein VHD85_06940 [Terracidiphilus sp.]|nr:hypothetical protein [Terracidiphilus sp.]